MTALSVSAYSLREQLGPISVPYTDQNGDPQVFRQDFAQALEIADFPTRAAEAFDVTGVEAVAFHFGGVDDPALDGFAERATAAGLALVNVAVDIGDLLASDASARAADVAELTRWIARLAELGFAFVRVNPGSPFSAQHGPVPPSYLVAALTELGDVANRHGIRLLVENHGGPSSDPAWMSALLDAVGSDRLGLLLDLGNFDAIMAPLMAAMFAEPGASVDPFRDLDLAPVYAGIDALADRAELVHVKAHLVDAAGVPGPIDLPRALEILSRHGYDGWLTVEYEGTGGDPWAATRDVVRAAAEAIGARR